MTRVASQGQEYLAGETLDSGLSFEQRLQLQEREMQMLKLRRKISQELTQGNQGVRKGGRKGTASGRKGSRERKKGV